MLGRETDWRQGNILLDSYAHSLGVVAQLNTNERVIVVTHDCDLPNQNELFVEAIKGTVVEKEEPHLVGARHPRQLHLRLTCSDGNIVCLELSHQNLIKLPKERLVETGELDRTLTLSQEEKRTLKQWLAARYGRPAFPNSFENRIKIEHGRRKVESQIGRIVSEESKYLVGIFFDLGEDRDNELPSEEPYFLSVSIVYDAIEGGIDARQSAEKVAEAIDELFTKAYGDAVTNKIILERCSAIADTAFHLSDLRKVDQWRLEYISASAEGNGDYIEVIDSLT
jgi:hypothetical protein